jgi:hypothetical protein
MKIQLATLIKLRDSLLLIKLGASELDPLTAWKLLQNRSAFDDPLNNYEEIRTKLILEKYGVEGENGQKNVPDDKLEDFRNELAPLVRSEIELPIYLIQVMDLPRLSADEMRLIQFMLDKPNIQPVMTKAEPKEDKKVTRKKR